MNIKRLITSALLSLFAVASFHAVADNVSVDEARAMANTFIKSHYMASPGSLKAPAMADIVLAHAEPSTKLPRANVYYMFNIKGGGFIIVSGEDHALPVLAYSDEGQLDFNNISEPLQDILSAYKAEIEYLLTHDIKAPKSFKQTLNEGSPVVGPLTLTEWGPESPYNTQCPPNNGTFSKVGCVAVAQAQYVYFWKYPVTCDSLPAYYGSRLKDTVPALPPTTFEYNKMLLSYGYWNINTQKFVPYDYTQEQVYEVAKLCRYCGQASKMNYSAGSSTSDGVSKGLMILGYDAAGKIISMADYELEDWHAIIKGILDQEKPIMYMGFGTGSPSHAFICDGYTDDDYFHMNLGWYGYNNGWYALTAFSFINRYDKYRIYDIYQRLIINNDPPLFCQVNSEINVDGSLFVLGDTFYPQAVDVDLYMTYRTLPFMFSLTDAQGNTVAQSDEITLRRLTFEQRSDITLAFTLPETLPNGTYYLHFNYRANDNEPLTSVVAAEEQLNVVGRLVKYGAPFGIADVVDAIDSILDEAHGDLNIGDVTTLIDYLLEN